MTTTELLAKVSQAGVELWIDRGKLRYRAPKGRLTPSLRTELEQNKEAILELLSQKAEDLLSSLPQLVPVPEQQHLPFPLTDIQQAYLIGRSGAFELGNVAAHAYFEIEGVEIDLERFNTALNQIIVRHGVLRTIILPNGNQETLKKIPPYQIEVLDLRSQPLEEVACQLEKVRDRMSRQILPIDQCPLFEIRASLLDSQQIRFHFSIDLLIADAWSVQILLRELIQLYHNPQASLPQLNISFRDYVQAVIAFKESPIYQRSLEYWRKRLATLPATPALPLAKNLNSIKQPQFTRRSKELNIETWRQLKTRAAQSGLTPSGVLCAAFAEVLARWSENAQFTLNLTLFNRLPFHPQVKDIMGDFTMTILLTVAGWQDTFKGRAQRLQEQIWEDLEYSHVSGVQILRELARIRGNISGAIMPVVFTSNLVGDNTTGYDGVFDLFSKVYGISQTPQVWLDHQVFEQAGTLIFNWDAVEEIFPTGLLDDMFNAYCQILQRLAWQESAWNESASNLILLFQTQFQPTFDIATVHRSKELLHTRFFSQVQERVQHPAVITPHQTLTYDELSRRANRLAHWLRSQNVRPNTLVAVVMEKGWEQIVAVLGILAAGAAYLPIDSELPEERQWYLLEQGDVQIVLTQSWLDRTLTWPEHIQRLRVDSEALIEESDQPLEPLQKPEDLAYVIYTSGSTGSPKGVMIDHQGAVNTILDVNQRFAVSVGDRVLALSSLSFDLSVYDIFGTLSAGGTIIIPEASAAKDPAHWATLIVQQQVTIWNSVPALMQMLVDYAPVGDVNFALDSLRLVLLSGDWIPLTLPDTIQNLNRHVQIVSLGGATEASIWSILYPITKVDPTWKSIPYGQPMTNQCFYVLNEALTPCPTWVAGSLYIGGIGLAIGYWQDEEKTRASFITHPQTGERLYRTGDRGRYLPDGAIEFLGREDFQVKVQGYRIELGEIESALEQHPNVRTAVVTAIGEKHSHKSLIAYISPDSKPAEIASELRSFLSEKLPKYMVPSLFIPLDTLPLTPNGKVDRKALPIPDSDRSELKETFVAPSAPIEEKLAGFWSQILAVKQIGIHDNFFELGGDSVQVAQLMAVVRETLKIELPLTSFFETPTIAGLTEAIYSALQAGPATETLTTDLNAEAVLDPAIHPDTLPGWQFTEPSRIFLTGATGFLGAHLLYELLQQTQADIYCLVRATNVEAGKKKIQSKLESYSLWNEDSCSRIIPVLGDLSQPRLGLSEQQFQVMAKSIDAIYHSAALVNFIYPYTAIKAVNVLATQEILNLASQTNVKPVHFISTLALFLASNLDVKVVHEQDSIDNSAVLYSGYAQSKWVAEKLVALARERGLPVCIYRPAVITGHSQTGVCVTNDLLSAAIKGCIQLGAVPDVDTLVHMSPVDYVSQAIIHLSRQETSLGKVFHLVNPHTFTWNQLTHWIQSFGYSLEQVSYDQWRSKLIHFPRRSLEISFYTLMPLLLSPEQLVSSGSLQFDCQNTLNGLANTDITCPPINPEMLHAQFSYYIQSGFLEAPKTECSAL